MSDQIIDLTEPVMPASSETVQEARSAAGDAIKRLLHSGGPMVTGMSMAEYTDLRFGAHHSLLDCAVEAYNSQPSLRIRRLDGTTADTLLDAIVSGIRLVVPYGGIIYGFGLETAQSRLIVMIDLVNASGSTVNTVYANLSDLQNGILVTDDAVEARITRLRITGSCTAGYEARVWGFCAAMPSHDINSRIMGMQARESGYVLTLTNAAGTTGKRVILPLSFSADETVRCTIMHDEKFPAWNGVQFRDSSGKELLTTKTVGTFPSTNSDWVSVQAYFQSKIDEDTDVRILVNITKSGTVLPVGQHDRISGFGNVSLYGLSPESTSIVDTTGSYDSPPVEVSGGVISNISILEQGGPSDHSAYALHTDRDQNENATLIVAGCRLESNSNSTVGIGTRNNYAVIFRRCVIVNTSKNPCVYVHNTSCALQNPHTTDNRSHVTFEDCIFVTDCDTCLLLQDWYGDTDYVEFTFRNCTFACADMSKAIIIEHHNYPESGGTWNHKFQLDALSQGNNIDTVNHQGGQQ